MNLYEELISKVSHQDNANRDDNITTFIKYEKGNIEQSLNILLSSKEFQNILSEDIEIKYFIDNIKQSYISEKYEFYKKNNYICFSSLSSKEERLFCSDENILVDIMYKLTIVKNKIIELSIHFDKSKLKGVSFEYYDENNKKAYVSIFKF